MSKVRVAILGCGGFAGAHARRLRENPDAQVVGLCDVSKDVTQGYMERNLPDYEPAPAQFTDAAEMYQTTEPDAVFICTPHTLHAEHANQALDAGCHVFMEKPMVTSADDAYALAEKVKQTGRILVVGYNTPCTPEFYYIRETIRQQRLGKLELISAYLSQGWMKATAGLWRQKPELSGGGQAYDSGAHLLNSLVWSVEDDIAEVHAFVDNHGTPVDINSSINVRFESGTMAAIAIGGNCPAAGSHMTFMFEGGRIDTNGWNGDWLHIYEGNKRIKYPHVEGDPQSPDDNFIDAVIGRAEPRTSAYNGIVQSDLMDAIYESARTGAPARPKPRATA